MKKWICFIFVIILIIFPVAFMLMIINRNNLQNEIVEYTEYLYFNWIDYPKQAETLDSISMEQNIELFEWFGYDQYGIPIKEMYENINYKYDGNYIFDKKFIGIPFEKNGELDYKNIFY